MSNPAIMFSSVDFPQPLGPSRQRNSFFATSRLISSSATTSALRFASLKILDTRDISIVAMSLPALDRGISLPGEDRRHHRPDPEIAQKTQQADAGHRRQHEVVTEEIIGVPEHIAEATLYRDHFGCDSKHPRRSNADSQASENIRKCGRQHDKSQQLAIIAANHCSRANQIAVAVFHTMDRVEQDRKKCAQKHQEYCGLVGYPEPDDREWNPRPGGNGPSHRQRWFDDDFSGARPADGDAQRDG